MNLGTQTNSLTNHLMSRATIGQPDPQVGMGATVLCWTDRHAATIFRVFKVGKSQFVEVRRDIATRVDRNGMSEAQDYTYKTTPNGSADIFRFNGGRWEHVRFNEDTKRWNATRGNGLRIGDRNEYHDFSF